MSKQVFPPGWDQARVQRLIEHYDAMDDEAMIAEDEAAREMEGHTVMVIPTDLVPEVRDLISRKASA